MWSQVSSTWHKCGLKWAPHGIQTRIQTACALIALLVWISHTVIKHSTIQIEAVLRQSGLGIWIQGPVWRAPVSFKCMTEENMLEEHDIRVSIHADKSVQGQNLGNLHNPTQVMSFSYVLIYFLLSWIYGFSMSHSHVFGTDGQFLTH